MSLVFKKQTQEEQTYESGMKCGDWRNVEIKMFEPDLTDSLTGTIQLFLCLLFYLRARAINHPSAHTFTNTHASFFQSPVRSQLAETQSLGLWHLTLLSCSFSPFFVRYENNILI